jgi:hypothetical protein
MTPSKGTAKIAAEHELLARVRKIKVVSVDCSFSHKGIRRARTVLRVDGRRVTVSAVTRCSLLRLLTGDQRAHTTDAVDRRLERIEGEYGGKLRWHPAYVAMQEVRAKHQQVHLLDDRIERLVAGAVANGGELEQLVEMVKVAWEERVVRDVMES